MLEFLFNNNNLITHSIQCIAAIIGIFNLKKYKNTIGSFFIGILIYISAVDLLAMYTYYCNTIPFLNFIANTKFESNYWWYTIFFDCIAVLLFAIFFYKIVVKNKYKNVIKYSAFLYLIVFVYIIFSDLKHLFIGTYSVIYTAEAILIMICTTTYFIEILESNKVLYFSKSLYFYVSVTVFLWWLIVTPVVFFDKYFITEDIHFIKLKRCIYIFANIFMYTTFSFGLIVSTPDKNKKFIK
ncbi:hypothetical protein [Lacinutrix sp. 5H-3-7-4]|uniref:hypothetical protein n=1 Tax=Lacinutrix sp. (strain 5H-3-7-4) TaxID=983544 RepID=UPI00020A3830|nr:hypothetical protein [Lacinutrix sp. 5H-3-7-4]AEH02134.1 hypothetical protein Lacal_2292 [Lacinutrix sp. 5H-3-7-4]